jgi:hypothetical protein
MSFHAGHWPTSIHHRIGPISPSRCSLCRMVCSAQYGSCSECIPAGVLPPVVIFSYPSSACLWELAVFLSQNTPSWLVAFGVGHIRLVAASRRALHLQSQLSDTKLVLPQHWPLYAGMTGIVPQDTMMTLCSCPVITHGTVGCPAPGSTSLQSQWQRTIYAEYCIGFSPESVLTVLPPHQ